jgi:hypothetical protein
MSSFGATKGKEAMRKRRKRTRAVEPDLDGIPGNGPKRAGRKAEENINFQLILLL